MLSQCDDPARLKDPDTYLTLPASPAELNPACGTTQGNTFFRKSDKETMTIVTLLCSTKITQNSESEFPSRGGFNLKTTRAWCERM